MLRAGLFVSLLSLLTVSVSVSFAQSPVSLDDLSAFQKPSKNWQIVAPSPPTWSRPISSSTQSGQEFWRI